MDRVLDSQATAEVCARVDLVALRGTAEADSLRHTQDTLAWASTCTGLAGRCTEVVDSILLVAADDDIHIAMDRALEVRLRKEDVPGHSAAEALECDGLLGIPYTVQGTLGEDSFLLVDAGLAAGKRKALTRMAGPAKFLLVRP